jgi:hypothetical protein
MVVNPRVTRKPQEVIPQWKIDKAVELLAAGEYGYTVAKALHISTASVSAINKGSLRVERSSKR